MKESTTTDLSTQLAEEREQLAAVEGRATALKEIADAAKISSEEDIEKAADHVTTIMQMKNEIEAIRKAFTGPLNEVIRSINSLCAPIASTLGQARGTWDKKILGFRREQREAVERVRLEDEKKKREQEEAARAEEAELRAKGDEEAADQAAAVAEEERVVEAEVVPEKTVRSTTGAKLTTRKTWTVEVFDLQALAAFAGDKNYPDRAVFVVPNSKMLNAMKPTKADPTHPEIPGVRFVEKESLST